MGKGPAAGALAASVQAAFRAQDPDSNVADVVTATDERVSPDLVIMESFATAFHAHLDQATGRVDYGDAGHGIAMHLRAGQQTPHLLLSHDLPLGVHPGAWRRTSGSLMLEPGDALIVCSDGVLDLYDGTLAALNQLATLYRLAPAAFLIAVKELVMDRGADDDITILVLTRTR
ncbi:hypothetical protein DEJ23_14815 [Curtobacterium sp. MCSS17_008]|nr:hypothetical protein DEJ23_14815 [Curtobacterium sp. MCSS17_008]